MSITELLARLDQLAASLRSRLETGLKSVTPLSEETAGLLVDWDRSVGEFRSGVAALAAEVGTAPPSWEDRVGAEAACEHLLRLRDGTARRERFRGLAEQLRAGTFTHRSARREQQLNETRVKAADECLALAQATTPPPELVGPPDGRDWLGWAWAELEDAFNQLVGAVAVWSPALSTLLEQGHTEWWVPAGSVSPSATRADLPPTPTASAEDSAAGSTAAASTTQETPSHAAREVAPSPPTSPPTVAPLPASVIVEATPQEAPPALEAIRPLDPTLTSLAAFERQFWTDPLSGQCVVAPWADNDFIVRVNTPLNGCLARVQTDGAALGPAWVFAAALRDLGHPAVRPDTLVTAADVWLEPHRTSVGLNPGRARTIREASGENPADLRLLLTLEAMRPTRDDLLAHSEITDAIGRAGFRSEHLKEVVRGLLQLHTLQEGDPLVWLRAALNKTTEPRPDPDDFLKKREQLHKEIQRVSLNAGSSYVGKFPHCGAAWKVFMEEVHPRVKEMYESGPKQWNPDAIATWLKGLLTRYEKIADRHDTREKSRKIMDRAAERLVAQIRELNNLMRDLLADAPAKERDDTGALRARLRKEVEALRGTKDVQVPDEAVAQALLLRALEPSAPVVSTHPLNIPAGLFVALPELLRLIPGPIVPPSGEKDDVSAPRFELLAPALKAAALLLSQSDPSGSPKPAGWNDVAATCRAAGAYDLLGVLLGAIPEADRQFTATNWNSVLVDLKKRQARVAKLWRDLVDLTVSTHPQVKEVLGKVNTAIEGEGADRRLGDPKLVAAWLDRLENEVTRMRDEGVVAWRAAIRAGKSPDTPARLRLLDDGRYAAAIHPHTQLADSGKWRETTWRHEAGLRWQNPRETLVELLTPQPPGKPLEVVQAWCEDPARSAPHNRAQRVRAQFCKWLLGPDLYDKKDSNDKNFIRIETEHLRNHLTVQQPTFIPQLHDARWVVFIVPLARPTDSDFVQKAADTIRQYGDNAIAVLLCPGITSVRRDELLRELRDRGAFAAVIDDIDLCRLLNPGGNQPNGVIGLLELILEQQSCTKRSPFSVAEGGDMRLEMYVGRREEAEMLATRGDYTRIFSGRKLGKTALLHYIRLTMNGRELANGRILRVLYVGIAGVRNESTFAKRVLDELRIEFPRAIPVVARYTADAFIDTIRQFLRDHPRDNLLIVLDEADEFVLAQVEEYRTVRKEAALSFKLRSETWGDPNDRRVRCVYTGYRATNTYDGVWVNAGEPLLLDPLAPEDAAALIGRPLARMGIDASEQADAIAFRCGYQPAVLLKFGAKLVKRLGEGGFRDKLEVTADDVTEVGEEAYVQDEIRRVVRANFQGNGLGQAAFAVLLDRLSKLPQGHGVQQAETEILEAFHSCWHPASVPEWMPPLDEFGSRSLIATQLKDMEDRKLLLRLPGDGGYRLTFPHHLTTLLSGLDLEKEVTTHLKAWYDQAKIDPASGRPGEFRGPLHRSDMILLREYIGGGVPELTPIAAVVGSLWPDGVDSPIGGLGERLGLDPSEVGNAATVTPGSRQSHRILQNADLARLRRVLDDPPADRPLILTGGTDLLRAALKESRLRPAEVQPLGPYRLTDGRVRWWFQRVRGVEFSGEHVYNDVYQLTGGVPFLVGLYDQLILPTGPHAGGLSMNATDETEAVRRFTERVKKDTFGLTDGPPAVRLSARELDLVRMVHVSSVAEPGTADLTELLRDFWTADLFGEAWTKLYHGRAFPQPFESLDEDAVALETLLLLGILPARPGVGLARQVGVLPPGDPIIDIWARLG